MTNETVSLVQLILRRLLKMSTNSSNSHEYDEINELIKRMSPYYRPEVGEKVKKEEVLQFEGFKTSIELKKGDKVILFDSITNTCTFFTRHGVCISAEVPSDWANTRIFQFMDSLLDLDKHLI
jgi:hypothetical protein